MCAEWSGPDPDTAYPPEQPGRSHAAQCTHTSVRARKMRRLFGQLHTEPGARGRSTNLGQWWGLDGVQDLLHARDAAEAENASAQRQAQLVKGGTALSKNKFRVCVASKLGSFT